MPFDRNSKGLFFYLLFNWNYNILNKKIEKINLENFKNGDGVLEAEYSTSIGNITIYADIEKGDIIVLKSDKIKDRSSDRADKRQVQDTH